MSNLTFKANSKEYVAGTAAAEKLDIERALVTKADSDGCYAESPEHARVRVTRLMRRKKGALVFFEIAAASRHFNVLARAIDQHPKATLVEDTRRGNRLVKLRQIDLDKIQIPSWSLTWAGGGQDELRGCEFCEELRLLYTKGELVDLGSGEKVKLNVGPHVEEK